MHCADVLHWRTHPWLGADCGERGGSLISGNETHAISFQLDTMEHLSDFLGGRLPGGQGVGDGRLAKTNLYIDVVIYAFLEELERYHWLQFSVALENVKLLGINLYGEVALSQSQHSFVCLHFEDVDPKVVLNFLLQGGPSWPLLWDFHRVVVNRDSGKVSGSARHPKEDRDGPLMVV